MLDNLYHKNHIFYEGKKAGVQSREGLRGIHAQNTGKIRTQTETKSSS